MTETKTEIPGDQEASKELAKSLLAQGATIEDVMAQTALSKPACLGLKGVLAKAQKRLVQASKPAYREANPTEAETKPQIPIQAENHSDFDGGLNAQHPYLPISPSITPEKPQYVDGSPFIHIDTASAIAFRESLPNPQKKLFDGYLALGQKSWKDQMQNHNGHDGHASGGYGASDPVKEAKARIYNIYADWMEEQTLANMVEKMRNPKDQTQKEETPQKVANQILEAIKLGVDLVPKGANVDPLGVYRAGRQDEQKTFENAVKQGETNTLDVQIENMKQLERIDNKKLDFETEKWRYEQENSGKTIGQVTELAKTILEGPVGKIVSDLGGAAKDRMRGANPSLTDVACPNCSHKFKVNKTLPKVQCPNCAMMLQAVAPGPTPQPQDQPQTENPTGAQPEPTPQEPVTGEPEATQHTTPDVDITSDVPAKPKHATSEGGE